MSDAFRNKRKSPVGATEHDRHLQFMITAAFMHIGLLESALEGSNKLQHCDCIKKQVSELCAKE